MQLVSPRPNREGVGFTFKQNSKNLLLTLECQQALERQHVLSVSKF
jgi:hypothetical protein